MITEKDYVEAEGVICPRCSSPEIETTSQLTSSGTRAFQSVGCNSCDFMWDDVYELLTCTLSEATNAETEEFYSEPAQQL